MEPITVTFSLEDTSRGYEITPSRVPLDEVIEFGKEVRDFIQGSDKEVSKEDLVISIEKGSLAFATGEINAPKLQADMLLLQVSADLSDLDAKRRAVMEGWQKAAKLNYQRAINIVSSAFTGRIRISHETKFVAELKENWVAVERYVRGELQDLGGVRNSNAHLRLHDGGGSITIKTDKSLVRAQSVNRVYHDVTVRIKAKLNLYTGEIKDAELIEFVEYAPKFDSQEFEQMTTKGRKAWADVDDHVKWIRELRGSD